MVTEKTNNANKPRIQAIARNGKISGKIRWVKVSMVASLSISSRDGKVAPKIAASATTNATECNGGGAFFLTTVTVLSACSFTDGASLETIFEARRE